MVLTWPILESHIFNDFWEYIRLFFTRNDIIINFVFLKKYWQLVLFFNFFFQNYFQQFLQDLLGLSDVECSKWTRVRDIIPKFSSILACLKSNIELVNISNNWFTLMFSLAEVSMNSIPICEAKLVDPQSFTSLKTDLRLVI